MNSPELLPVRITAQTEIFVKLTVFAIWECFLYKVRFTLVRCRASTYVKLFPKKKKKGKNFKV